MFLKILSLTFVLPPLHSEYFLIVLTLRAFFQALLRMASSIACRLRFQDFQCIAHFCTMALCPLQKPQNKNTCLWAWFAEATSSSISNPQSTRKRMAKGHWSIEALNLASSVCFCNMFWKEWHLLWNPCRGTGLPESSEQPWLLNGDTRRSISVTAAKVDVLPML